VPPSAPSFVIGGFGLPSLLRAGPGDELEELDRRSALESTGSPSEESESLS
jgi:hypothetical protein